jgi:hypothetical protein
MDALSLASDAFLLWGIIFGLRYVYVCFGYVRRRFIHVALQMPGFRACSNLKHDRPLTESLGPPPMSGERLVVMAGRWAIPNHQQYYHA